MAAVRSTGAAVAASWGTLRVSSSEAIISSDYFMLGFPHMGAAGPTGVSRSEVIISSGLFYARFPRFWLPWGPLGQQWQRFWGALWVSRSATLMNITIPRALHQGRGPIKFQNIFLLGFPLYEHQFSLSILTCALMNITIPQAILTSRPRTYKIPELFYVRFPLI